MQTFGQEREGYPKKKEQVHGLGSEVEAPLEDWRTTNGVSVGVGDGRMWKEWRLG